MAVLIYDPTGQLRFGTLIEATGEEIPLCGRSLVIGSSLSDCDIAITDDPSVSPRHCEIKRGGGRIILEATRTVGTTLVNGQATTQSELNDGDSLQIGNTQLTLALSQPAAAAPTIAPAPPVSAAPSTDDAWYTEIAGQYHGPFTLEQLKDKIASKQLGRDDYIKQGPAGTPQPAGRFPATKPLFLQPVVQSEPANGWFAQVGSDTHGPLTLEEVADWIRSSRLNVNDYVRFGERGTPQPAGRTAELKAFFLPPTPNAPTPQTAPTPAPSPKEARAQSPELQDMVDALEPAAELNAATEAPPVVQQKKPRKKPKTKAKGGRKRKQAGKDDEAAIDALLDDVLFSDEPPPAASTPSPAADSVEPTNPVSQPTEPSYPPAPNPPPSQPAIPSPPRKAPPKPKKAKAKARPSSGESFFSEPKNVGGLVAAVVLAAICAFVYWPASYESNRPQLVAMKEISDEMHAMISKEASAEEWAAFNSEANRKGLLVSNALKLRKLDSAGQELEEAVRLLPSALKDAAQGKTVGADLVKTFITRAGSLLGE